MVPVRFFILAVLLYQAHSAQAQSSFKGYPRVSEMGSRVVHERLLKYSKEKDDFYLLITNHEALYRFPRSVDIDDQVEGFLKSRMKKQTVLQIELDRKSTEILKIGDPQ